MGKETSPFEKFIYGKIKDRKEFHRFILKNQTHEFYNGLTGTLCDSYPHWFHEWWNKDLFNYEKHSFNIAKNCPDYFNTWFDKDLYNYGSDTSYLVCYNSRHFKKWWDEYRICNYINLERDLVLNCMKYKKYWYKTIFYFKLTKNY